MGAGYRFGEDTPAVRRGDESRCPFCGGSVIRSHNDVGADGTRVDLFCENPACDVREMAVIATRVGTYNPRADLAALNKIDEGTLVEQEEFGATATRDRRDAAEYMRFRVRRPDQRLRRRTRPTFISIDIAPDWPTAHRKNQDALDAD